MCRQSRCTGWVLSNRMDPAFFNSCVLCPVVPNVRCWYRFWRMYTRIFAHLRRKKTSFSEWVGSEERRRLQLPKQTGSPFSGYLTSSILSSELLILLICATDENSCYNVYKGQCTFYIHSKRPQKIDNFISCVKIQKKKTKKVLMKELIFFMKLDWRVCSTHVLCTACLLDLVAVLSET